MWKESGKIMVYKCPNCGGALEYSVTKNKMVCDHCEDDYVQRTNPDFKGGANKMSLNEAIATYKNGGKVE